MSAMDTDWNCWVCVHTPKNGDIVSLVAVMLEQDSFNTDTAAALCDEHKTEVSAELVRRGA